MADEKQKPEDYTSYRIFDGFLKANPLMKLVYVASVVTVIGPVLFEGATLLRAHSNKKAKTLLELKDAKLLIANESKEPVVVIPPGIVIESEKEAGSSKYQDAEKQREATTRVTISTPPERT